MSISADLSTSMRAASSHWLQKGVCVSRDWSSYPLCSEKQVGEFLPNPQWGEPQGSECAREDRWIMCELVWDIVSRYSVNEECGVLADWDIYSATLIRLMQIEYWNADLFKNLVVFNASMLHPEDWVGEDIGDLTKLFWYPGKSTREPIWVDFLSKFEGEERFC
jgi:hypothetical protein